MRIRFPKPEEMQAVYMMGFDAWTDSLQKTKQEYLEECSSSPRYAEGTWYVLEDEEKKQLLSSLIVHPLKPWEQFEVRGIGSVATHPDHRNKGYATEILTQVLKKLEFIDHVGVVLIGAENQRVRDFYSRNGFDKLPDSFQNPGQPTLMARTSIEFKLRALQTTVAE